MYAITMRKFLPFVSMIFFLALTALCLRYLFSLFPHLTEEVEFQLFVFGSILLCGYLINRVAPKTAIPSFVWAIFAGMSLQPMLEFYTHQTEGFKVAMEIMAALVLFAGGLEVPFKSFKKWFGPIATLSLVGVILSASFFTLGTLLLLSLLGIYETSLVPAVLILATALASTDPTAIIPTLKTMRFKRPFLKEIAVSESALTDVTGSIITRFVLIALLSIGVSQQSSVVSYLFPLFQKSSYDALALQIMTGILIGYLGYALLKNFYRTVQSHEANSHEQADPALLLSIPIFTFVLGNILGGAGFLAAFISGLLSEIEGGVRKVAHFYTNLLDHLVKPFIFISLGALVPIDVLFAYAPLGILAGLSFIFLIRPLVVFISLLPWLINHTFKFNDLLFLSMIRETGIIAAVLLIISATYEIIQSNFVISVGMWVILLTLMIEPPLTPYLSRRIGVSK